MDEAVRTSRIAGRSSVETLEGRVVLSLSSFSITHGSPMRLGGSSIQYQLDRHYVSPQSGTVELTVTRSSAGAQKAKSFKVETSGMVELPMPSTAGNPSSHGPIGSRLSKSGGPNGRGEMRELYTTGRNRSPLPIAPIDGTYRFAPGQTSLTIPLRLNPNFVPPGDALLEVIVSEPRSHYKPWTGEALSIVPSPDLVRPEVISSSLSPQAITLTFSKPMNPATVEDINNYEITGDLPMTPLPASGTFRNPGEAIPLPSNPVVTLKSAVYDPANHTVTLTPTDPLTLSSYSMAPRGIINIANPIDPSQYLPAPGAKPLADLQGNLFLDTLPVQA